MGEVEECIVTHIYDVTGIKIDTSRLYSDKKNVSPYISFARSLSFFILHNYYGLTYNAISRRSNMLPVSVMRSIRKLPSFLSNEKIQTVFKQTINKYEAADE